MSNIFEFEEQLGDNISAMRPNCSFLEALNPEQKEAVLTTEGPLLVLSGAGTGKTRVLTTRLAYILSTLKAAPWNCLVVTFTNRAATEMKNRVYALIGEMANSVWLGTFHSICVKILRAHAELAGLKPNFTILDEDDQKRLIKKILEAEAIDQKKYPPEAFVEKIARYKDKALTVDKVLSSAERGNITAIVYTKYQARLKEINAVDFGDIILETLNIFLNYSDILQQYGQKFKYIMVDEYQDTNVTQYLLLRLLSQEHRNLCCVGDDDQSIYSWRGAEIENILRFETDFADARIIRLERNYRSTANILQSATALISHNTERLGKILKVAENSPAAGQENEKIKVISVYNGQEEAAFVTREIEKLHQKGLPYADMAVLVRTAFQTREFEERFISEAVPYQVIGGLKFYERQEIKDLLAYFRVILQPEDDLALSRIINKPARKIGEKTIDKLQQYAYAHNVSMFEAIKALRDDDFIAGKTKDALLELLQKFESWQQQVSDITPDNLASVVLEESGYLDMLKSDSSADAPGRIDNLKELVSVMSDVETYPTLADFLEHVSLVMDNDNALDENKVRLMTLHAAKGLEFQTVFLPGWEETLFPHQRCLEENGENALQEERRLAYVALTRAKQKLYILAAFARRIYGNWQNNMPSRFLNELPGNCLEIINNTYASGIADRYQTYSTARSNSFYRSNPYKKETPSSAPATKGIKNMRVYHLTFGYGTLVKTEGDKCVVSFDEYGLKNVLKNYLRRA